MKSTKSVGFLIVSMVIWSLSCATLFPNMPKEDSAAPFPNEPNVPTAVSESTLPVSNKFTGEIVFTEGDEIYSINADGTGKAKLGIGISPVWSPDSAQIAFLSDPDGDLEYDIFLMNSDGTDQRAISLDHPEYDAPKGVDWHPNGNLIIFSAYSATGAEWDKEIFTIDITSATVSQITSNKPDDWSPSWSINGEQIIYISPELNEAIHDYEGRLHLMDADGAGEILLTTQGIDDDPVFSPDGTLIAFTSARLDNDGFGTGRQLYIMNSDGSNERLLSADPRTSSPAWSPDGQFIICTIENEDGVSQLFIISVDGSDLTYLTDGSSADWKP